MKTGEGDMGLNLYDEKNSTYFSCARTEITPLLGKSNGLNLRVLEIGCSEGHTLEWLKKSGYCSWTAGVELYADLHPDIQSIDKFYKIDIEKELPDIPLGTIDLILCLDVLEHLVNPWEAVRKIDRLLKPGGQLIISVPNVQNYHVISDLVFRGSFEYTESGIMDRTHLRFFTRRTAIELAESAGATVTDIIGAEYFRWQKRLLSALGLGNFLAKQFLIAATKP